MKQALIFFMFLLLLCCKKEEIYWPIGNNWKGTQQFGKCTAALNGQAWEASCAVVADGDSTFFLSIGTYDSIDNVLTERLSFQFVPFKVGKNSVGYTGVRSRYSLVFDDLLNAQYLIDSMNINSLEITEIDKNNNLMRGSFKVVYKRDDRSSPNWPPYARFEDGKFEVKI